MKLKSERKMTAMQMRELIDNQQNEMAAMRFVLKLITIGAGRIERSETCPDLVEFCFGGMRYRVDGDDWWKVIRLIGVEKIVTTIADLESALSPTGGQP